MGFKISILTFYSSFFLSYSEIFFYFCISFFFCSLVFIPVFFSLQVFDERENEGESRRKRISFRPALYGLENYKEDEMYSTFICFCDACTRKRASSQASRRGSRSEHEANKKARKRESICFGNRLARLLA